MDEQSTTEHLLSPLRQHVSRLEEELGALKNGADVQLFGQSRDQRAERVRCYIIKSRGHLARMIETYRERYGAL